MTIWTMIVAVVSVVMTSVLLMHWISTKGKIEKAAADTKSDDKDSRIAKLEGRVAVLERLATDRGQKLSDEIDSL